MIMKRTACILLCLTFALSLCGCVKVYGWTAGEDLGQGVRIAVSQAPQDDGEWYATVDTVSGKLLSVNLIYPKEWGDAAASSATADGKAIELDASRGERESVQLLVTPGEKDLTNVKVAVSDLKAANGAVLASAAIRADVMGYVNCTNMPPYHVGHFPRKAELGWWPDPILDFLKTVDVKRGDVQSFWLRVTCPREQPAGTYEGTVTVTADGVRLVKPTVTGVRKFDLGEGGELKDLRLTWDAKADFGDAELHQKIKVKLMVEKAD